MWMRRRFMKRKALMTCITAIFFVAIVYMQDKRKMTFGVTVPLSRPGKQLALKSLKGLGIKTDFDDRYVVFNRVPKCASMTMTTVCYKLGAENGFKVASPYEPGEKPVKTEDEQKQFIAYLHSQPKPYMYIRHQYFIDFEKFSEKQPIYINMIRDPIARFESFYYFSRFGNQRGGGGAKARLEDERTHETIDECVQKRRPECTKPYWQVVPYFCGQEPGCMSRSSWAVERAKENIRKHYAFVGTLEDLDDSLKLLQKLVPAYFQNADLYIRTPESLKIRNETLTRNKSETSVAAKDFLKRETSLSLEYDLYNFVRERLLLLKDLLLHQ